jgi:hypothetical protein
MSDFREHVRDTLRAIDVKQYAKENHGGAKYVPWPRIWDLILTHFPESEWPEFHEEWIGPEGDQTVMVHCKLTLRDRDGNECSNTMHLPVMESYGQFKAIKNPDGRDISDTRMRCFVKCAGVFGLGLEMWSGEDYDKANKDLERIVSFAKKKGRYRRKLWETAMAIQEAYDNDEPSVAAEAWYECSEDEMKDLWLAETKGGFFSQAEKEWIKKATWAAKQESAA